VAAKILKSQRIAITGASAPSTAMALGLKYAIKASADCTIRFGASGVVAAADTANNWFMNKGETIEYSPSDANDQFVAVIGTSGSLYIATLEGSS
jgi:hypothetical protein